MERFISATEANQRFSEMLRDVQSGESFVVTSRGEPVAKLIPLERDDVRRREDIREMLDYMKALPVRIVGEWRRDDLYDR